MPRTAGVVLLVIGASVVSLLPSQSANAQLTGSSNGAALFSPVDASALGVSRLSSVGLSLTDAQFVVGGGLGMAGGSLRGYAGGGAFAWSTGLGYASTFVRRSLADGRLHGTIGGQLTGGYRHESYTSEAGALNMTVPVGVRVGNPDGRSLTVYAAPYVELGVERFRVNHCSYNEQCYQTSRNPEGTYGGGIGLGARASAGRFALGILARDFGDRTHLVRSPFTLALGFSFQLGEARGE